MNDNIPIHLDPSVPLTVPEEVKERLRKNEARQRYLTNRKNKERAAAGHPLLPVEKVDIIAIAIDNNWTCGCHKVFGHNGCWKRVDITKKGAEIGAPVFGHIVARSLEGGHTNNNCDLFRSECNHETSRRIETSKAAKYKRTRRAQTGKNEDGTNHKPKFKKPIPAHSRGLQSKSKWPKGRKIKSKPFGKPYKGNDNGL